MENKGIAIFENRAIRRVWHDGEWWFSVVDICWILTNQVDELRARKYWNKVAQRLREEESEVVTNCHHFKLKAIDGKMRATELHKTRDSTGFKKLHTDAHDGGKIAGRTRKDIETQTGKSIPTRKNFLNLKEQNKLEN